MKSRSIQRQLGRLSTQSGPSSSVAAASSSLHYADRGHRSASSSATASSSVSSSRLFSSTSAGFKNALNARSDSQQCGLCAGSPRHFTIEGSEAKVPSSRLASALSLSSSSRLPHTSSSITTRIRSLHTSPRYLQQQKASSPRNAESVDHASSRKPASSEIPTSSTPSEDQAAPKPSDVSIGEVRRLARLAVPEKKTLGIALGLLTISSAVSLSVPFTLGRIIDFFTSASTADLPVSVPTAAALLAGIFAIGAAANTGRSILMRIAGQRIVMRVREQAYENTLKLDMAKYDLMGHATDDQGKLKELAVPGKSNELSEAKYKAEDSKAVLPEDAKTPSTKPAKSSNSLSSALSLAGTEGTPDVGVRGVGDVISRLGSDSSIVGESLTRELSEGLRSLATVVVGIGMMVYISAKLTTLMLFIVPPSAIGAVVYGRYLKKLSRRTQKKIGEMIALAEERLSSVRTVQAFNSVEPKETKAFSKKVHEIFDLSKKEAYASGLFYGGAGFSGNITMLALLSYGGKLVSQGEITVGDLSSLMLYTAYVGGSLVSLTTFFSTIMKGLGAAGRVFELLDAKPSTVTLSQGIKLSPNAPPRTLTFSNVNFSYPSRPSVPILKDFNLSIDKGRSIAVAGGSGSGKSTLVNLLVRFYDPTTGEIRYGNEDIRKFTPESWRDRVSMVPQDPALFSQTIAENIAYGKPDATMSEIREAARLANCDFIEDLPLGFDTMVGPKAAQLSGGQRQRIAIARALVRKPSILILDEATSALDAASETLVNEAVKNITSSHSLTTILIAHRLSTLKTADEIAFMMNGQVVERGTYEELAREGTEFWNSVRSQMLGTTVSMTPKELGLSEEEKIAQKSK